MGRGKGRTEDVFYGSGLWEGEPGEADAWRSRFSEDEETLKTIRRVARHFRNEEAVMPFPVPIYTQDVDDSKNDLCLQVMLSDTTDKGPSLDLVVVYIGAVLSEDDLDNPMYYDYSETVYDEPLYQGQSLHDLCKAADDWYEEVLREGSYRCVPLLSRDPLHQSIERTSMEIEEF